VPAGFNNLIRPVSVPKRKGDHPRATTDAEPELEPPLMLRVECCWARHRTANACRPAQVAKLIKVGFAKGALAPAC